MNRLSVITICFNNLDDVIKTCKSVDEQTTTPFEHIIIDGSTNTQIKEYLEGHQQPPYRRWNCERDKGIADAFNKGIKAARGEITTLLNSGDTFYDSSVLKRVIALFDADKQLMWCNGKLNMFRAGIWSVTGKKFEKEKLYRGMHGVFHPTIYVKREVYDRCGFFDLTIKMAMDYDFICRIADEKNDFIDYPLATFDPSGVSSTNYVASTNEMFECYRKYFGSSLKQILWQQRLLLLHKLLNSSLGKWLYKMKVNAGMQKV
jgi:glycosyltransferase involved in cell wall biosynthesis